MSQKLKWVKDLVEFDDFELNERGVRFEFHAYGKVKDVEYLGKSDQIKSVVVVKYLNMQDYLNDGPGFPVEKEYTFSNIPAQIMFLVKNRDLLDKGFISE